MVEVADVPDASDRGRREVYAAELMAFDGTELELVEPLAVVQAFVEQLLSAPWWPGRHVTVRAARRDALASTTRIATTSHAAEIRLAGPQCTRATAVHELAHVLAGPDEGHGAQFRRAHVDLAAVAFGAERGGWLAEAYADAGLGLGARTWPETSAAGPGHVIAL
ncbi:hypothetical protein BH23ACT3_BH23ACT3_23440 [soil metagenome]